MKVKIEIITNGRKTIVKITNGANSVFMKKCLGNDIAECLMKAKEDYERLMQCIGEKA